MFLALWLLSQTVIFALPAQLDAAVHVVPVVPAWDQGQPSNDGCDAGFQSGLDYDAGLASVATEGFRHPCGVVRAASDYDSAPVSIIPNASSPRAPPGGKAGFLAAKTGPTVFRQGTFADEAIGWEGNYVKGKYWATDNPLTTPGYAKKYGLPAENTGNPDWVVGGMVQGNYTTRPAPPSHNNPVNTGGATEVLNPENVQLDWFHMPD